MRAFEFPNLPHRFGTNPMSKRIQTSASAVAPADGTGSFGERLAALSKAAGFTQVELGISQRMVAYYESPQANLMPHIATALGVSIDKLFGRGAKRRLVKHEGDSRLRRRLLAIENLDLAEKRQVLQLIDAFIERGQLKRKMESRT